MAEVERIQEITANRVRAGAVVSSMSQAVQEREYSACCGNDFQAAIRTSVLFERYLLLSFTR